LTHVRGTWYEYCAIGIHTHSVRFNLIRWVITRTRQLLKKYWHQRHLSWSPEMCDNWSRKNIQRDETIVVANTTIDWCRCERFL
jgi:hypothetical protein